MKIYIKKLRESVNIPKFATPGSAGMDIFSANEDDIVIPPMKWDVIPTGFAMEIPPGFEAQIRPRSGLALKYGVTVLNSPGTIDSDYRGEVKVILINLSNKDFVVRSGMRIAQMVISKVESANIHVKNELSNTKRGSGGFGHSGH